MSESVCLQCENKRICATGVKQPNERIIVGGCSRFEQKKTITHADRIRSMTDEELAEFMRPWDSGCPRWKENPLPCSDWDNCGECWLKWLKEEVSE